MKHLLNILRNIVFIKACYGYALVRGVAKKMPNEVREIFVVQSAKMGDMVCSTPVMHALRAQFPQAHITVLGDTIGKQILEGNSDVDDYCVNNKNFFTLLCHCPTRPQF